MADLIERSKVIEAYIMKCPCFLGKNTIDRSAYGTHIGACGLEFNYIKICPSSNCLCAERFGLKKMDDLISRQAAIDAVQDEISKESHRPHQITLLHAKRRIEDLPSAQSEPKSPVYYGGCYASGGFESACCPICGYIYDKSDTIWGEPFCPHCGQMLDWNVKGEQDG